MAGVGWTRFVFHAPNGLDAAFAFYDPIIRAYVASGTKVLLILLQDTFWGNGPWANGNWPAYTIAFAAVAGAIAAHYKGVVAAYEIWNEPDNVAPTSIYIAPEVYGLLIAATSKAIRAADPAAKVISGGLSGADPIGYLTRVRAQVVTLPCDAVGYHPYGKTPPDAAVFDWQRNTLAPALQSLHNTFNLPIWITEIGVPRVNVNDTSLWPVIGNYMHATFSYIRSITSVCPVLIWFAWSDSQDSAGIVHDDQTHKGAIWDACAANVKADTTRPNQPPVPPPTSPVVSGNKTTGNRYGLHIETQGLFTDKGLGKQLIDMIVRLDANGHRLASVVVVDSIAIMNAIAPHVNYPIFRSWLNNQKFNPSALTSKGTAEKHADYIYDQTYQIASQLVLGCYVQFRNENNVYAWDSDFDLELMYRARIDKRFQVAIGGYNTGTPEVVNWQAYQPALRDAMAHGDIVILHEYGFEIPLPGGQSKETDFPVSGDQDYPDFGGRDERLYASAPDDCKPVLVIGECGASDGYTHPDTPQDWQRFNALKKALPWCGGFCWWGYGSSTYNANPTLAEFEATVMAL